MLEVYWSDKLIIELPVEPQRYKSCTRERDTRAPRYPVSVSAPLHPCWRSMSGPGLCSWSAQAASNPMAATTDFSCFAGPYTRLSPTPRALTLEWPAPRKHPGGGTWCHHSWLEGTRGTSWNTGACVPRDAPDQDRQGRGGAWGNPLSFQPLLCPACPRMPQVAVLLQSGRPGPILPHPGGLSTSPGLSPLSLSFITWAWAWNSPSPGIFQPGLAVS